LTALCPPYRKLFSGGDVRRGFLGPTHTGLASEPYFFASACSSSSVTPEGLGAIDINIRARIVVKPALMLYRHTHILECINGFVRVGDLEGDVVNALAVRIEKFLPGCVIADRLDQFQRDLPEIQECELCLPVGWVSPVDELRFAAWFNGENPRWSDAQNRCPRLLVASMSRQTMATCVTTFMPGSWYAGLWAGAIAGRIARANASLFMRPSSLTAPSVSRGSSGTGRNRRKQQDQAGIGGAVPGMRGHNVGHIVRGGHHRCYVGERGRDGWRLSSLPASASGQTGVAGGVLRPGSKLSHEITHPDSERVGDDLKGIERHALASIL